MPASVKPALSYEELREIIKISLWTGQLLLQHGADSARVQETMHRVTTGLGCDWVDIVVNMDSILASTIHHGDFRTKARYIPQRGVNMAVLARINDLSHQVTAGELDRAGLYQALRAIDSMQLDYNRRIVVVAVGLACAAFSQLFGGEWLTFLITGVSASAAMVIRQELHRRYINPLLITVVTAFVGGVCAGGLSVLLANPTTQSALVASVILLVPGVSLINAAKDLLNGYISAGITRGVTGFLVSLAIALGLSIAIWLTGVAI